MSEFLKSMSDRQAGMDTQWLISHKEKLADGNGQAEGLDNL